MRYDMTKEETYKIMTELDLKREISKLKLEIRQKDKIIQRLLNRTFAEKDLQKMKPKTKNEKKQKLGEKVGSMDENNINKLNARVQMLESDNRILAQRLKEKDKDITLLGVSYQKEKDKINRTLNMIETTIETIKMQPSDDDTWILKRLNGFKSILRGDGNER